MSGVSSFLTAHQHN